MKLLGQHIYTPYVHGRYLGDDMESPGQRIFFSPLAPSVLRVCVIPAFGVQNPTALELLPMMLMNSYAGGYSCPSMRAKLPTRPRKVVSHTALGSVASVADTLSRSRSVTVALCGGVWNAGLETPAASAAAAITHAVSYDQSITTVRSCG
jgi:hypothetical protein